MDWRILFTLEFDLNAGRYKLGGFYCFHWPEQYQGDPEQAEQNWEATILLLKAAGRDPVECGVPDVAKLAEFLKYSWLRARMDNKATNAMLMRVTRSYSKEEIADMVLSKPHETLKRWQEDFKVSHTCAFFGELVRA